MKDSITRRVLARLESPYAVCWGEGSDRAAYAASESRQGPLLRLDPDGGEVEVIASGPGGCMGIVSLSPLGLEGVAAIEEFFPVFQSEDSGVSVYLPPRREGGAWTRRRVLDIPFLHRLVPFQGSGAPVFLAGQLCRAKQSRDDWSSPGAVYLVEPFADGLWRAGVKPLLDGIHRNHGMQVGPEGDAWVSGDEGVFRLFRESSGGKWVVEQVMTEPTSDIRLFDLDGDGRRELLAIHPFHGDRACLYRRVGPRKWEKTWETGGEFGHVAWAGRLGGEPALVLGWRGGDRALEIHRPEGGGLGSFRSRVIESDSGPLNIAVRRSGSRDLVLAALGVPGEIVLYEFA